MCDLVEVTRSKFSAWRAADSALAALARMAAELAAKVRAILTLDNNLDLPGQCRVEPPVKIRSVLPDCGGSQAPTAEGTEAGEFGEHEQRRYQRGDIWGVAMD